MPRTDLSSLYTNLLSCLRRRRAHTLRSTLSGRTLCMKPRYVLCMGIRHEIDRRQRQSTLTYGMLIFSVGLQQSINHLVRVDTIGRTYHVD